MLGRVVRERIPSNISFSEKVDPDLTLTLLQSEDTSEVKERVNVSNVHTVLRIWLCFHKRHDRLNITKASCLFNCSFKLFWLEQLFLPRRIKISAEMY